MAMNQGPSEARGEKMPTVKQADKNRDLGTEIARTEEKINQILSRLDTVDKPSSKLKKIKKRATEIKDKLDKLISNDSQSRSKLTLKTLDKLNTTFDKNLKGFRIPFLKNLLQASVKDIKLGNVNSLITAFALLKSDDRPLKIPGSKYKIHRRGHNLILEKGKESIAFKVALVGDKWQIQNADGQPLSMTVNRSRDPLYGLKKGLYEQDFYSKERTKLKYTVKKPKAVSRPTGKKEAAPKPREMNENQKKQLLADTFKTISNPDIHGQELTPKQLATLQSFTKSVGKGEIKHFKHGNTETYVARSKDGAVWRISTRVKDSHGNTSTGEKYYAPRATTKITHKIPEQYKGRVQFKGNPTYTIKSPSELAAGRRPKNIRKKYDAGKPTPDPKILAMFKSQEKKAQQEAYLAKEMKPWITGVKKAVASVLKRLQWFSNLKVLAKNIQKEKKCTWKQASDDAVRFKSRCEQCDKSISTGNQTPKQILARIERVINRLPAGSKIQGKYAKKFDIKTGKTLLASLGKTIPSAAIPRTGTIPRPTTNEESAKNPETASMDISSLVQPGADKYIDKTISKTEFSLKNIKNNVQIHNILLTPPSSIITIKIIRKNGEVVDAVCYPRKITYVVVGTPGTKWIKRARIYNGDKIKLIQIQKHPLNLSKSEKQNALNERGFKNLAKDLKITEVEDINNWTGTGKNAAELKLVFNIKNGKSPVMKDKNGNEFYLKIDGDRNSDTMSVYIKNKGEKSFKLAFKEVDGEMDPPATDIRLSPEKTVKKPSGTKERREAYDKNMEKNVKTLMSKFKKLKPNDLGVSFKTKKGEYLSVFKADKDTCYTINKDGEKETFSLSDRSEVRNMAQLVANNPEFKDTLPPDDARKIAKANEALTISPREKVDIKESVGVLKKMLEGKNIRTVMKSNKQDLKDYLAHIGGVHKRKNIPGKYNIAKGYTMDVSKNGIVKLTHKGEGTLTYPKRTEA